MNKIDELTKQLLFNLLKEVNRYNYQGKAKYGGLLFEINTTKIIVRWFSNSDKDTYTNIPITIKDFNYNPFPLSWSDCNPSNDGYHFVLEINGLRPLKVSKLTRIEEAQIFTKIEELANWHEKYVLENLINSTTSSVPINKNF